MSKEVDAWEDEWSNVADTQTQATPPSESGEPKKVSSRVTKAQRRAQQAEFNRQLWAEAEGPQETNYFLESRNVVPLRSEFKPPPILLSRKGPIVHQAPRPLTSGMQALNLRDKNAESSDDDDDEETKPRELTLAERQAQAAKEREEKQRRYEERRQQLFGPANGTQSSQNQHHQHQHPNMSGTSTPSSLTPPGSRSATPNRGRGRGGRRGGAVAAAAANTTTNMNMNMNMKANTTTNANMNMNTRTNSRGSQQPRDLYDPSYAARPESSYMQRRAENGFPSPSIRPADIQPIRAPRGPDGSGRGGFGFANPRIGQVGGHGS